MDKKTEIRFKKRSFRAFEICSFHLDMIKNSDDAEAQLWRVLREAEADKMERHKLWELVISCAREFHSVNLMAILKAQQKHNI